MAEGFCAIQRVTNQPVNNGGRQQELACCNVSCEWQFIVCDLQQEQNLFKSADGRWYMADMFAINGPIYIICEPLIVSHYHPWCKFWSCVLDLIQAAVRVCL